MVIYELRQSVYNKAFDLIEDAKKSNKKTKLALCELYDCLVDCYESEVDDEYEEGEYGDENYAEIGEVEIGEINYRDDEESQSFHHKYYPEMRRGMRKSTMGGMRGNMRRRQMRQRRDRLGRYSY